MHTSVKYIHDNAETLSAEHIPSDEAGQLSGAAIQVLLDSRGMRLMQSVDRGGFEASPADFMEWVRSVGRYNPSAGWVAGVVGVHPWEIALVDTQLQEEIYGEDPDTWVASPYAPQGRAVPVDGGFRFTGEWQYSTGTDHCDWVVLGGLIADKSGMPQQPVEMCHFFLPRTDYEIVPDSWDTLGLLGTGSKNVRVTDVFVPAYRTVDHTTLSEGGYAARRPGCPLFQLPWGCMFSAAIAASTFGIAEGAIEQYRASLQTRRSTMGVVGKTDPFQQEALAEVEADLAAGIAHVDMMIEGWLAQLAAGDTISKGQRLQFRRNQVRAVQRVLFGVDKLFSRAGSAAIWTPRGLERYWRDLRTAGTHVCDMADVVYCAWANHAFDTEGPVNVMH